MFVYVTVCVHVAFVLSVCKKIVVVLSVRLFRDLFLFVSVTNIRVATRLISHDWSNSKRDSQSECTFFSANQNALFSQPIRMLTPDVVTFGTTLTYKALEGGYSDDLK